MSNEENSLSVVNITKWLAENKENLLPPVCNKLLHNEQLIVMFVGGPNVREDYHIEEGEELFYQLKGDICVKIIEENVRKDVVIKEGEFFILPARIPHSPQRTAGSIGLVIERKRGLSEIDAVRWYIPQTTSVLYEKWFHCKDLGVELVPLIREYFNSNEYKTKLPGENVKNEADLPYKLSRVNILKDLHGPFNLIEKIKSNIDNLLNLTPKELNLQFEVSILKKSSHTFNDCDSSSVDLWFLQLNGNSAVQIESKHEIYKLEKWDSLFVPAKYCDLVTVNLEESDSLVLKVSQNPMLK